MIFDKLFTKWKNEGLYSERLINGLLPVHLQGDFKSKAPTRFQYNRSPLNLKLLDRTASPIPRSSCILFWQKGKIA